MADNTQLNTGVGGDLVRTDDVGGGVKIPVSKIHSGADGVDGGPITTVNPFPVQQPQRLDAGNSPTITLANASPGVPFVGTWTLTRSEGIVRQLTVLASNVSSGLGGTFTFQYSEDGASATISEERTITDFATVRDFDLLNAGAYYRIMFEPSRVMTAGESIFITTTHRTQWDGFFVRLLTQPLERQNITVPHLAAFLRGFDETGSAIDVNTTLSDGSRQCLNVASHIPGIGGSTRGQVTTGATTEVAIRKTTYTEQGVGAQRSVSSTSLLDTAAGTGARTIRITYFTLTAGVIAGPFTETLTLLGITPVNTVATDIALVESIEVITAGSTGVAQGIVQLWTTTLGLGSVFASIAALDRRSFYGHHYVPNGKRLKITALRVSSSAGSGNVPMFTVRSISYGPALVDVAEMFLTEAEVAGSDGTKSILFGTPITVAGPARVTLYCTPANSASQVQRGAIDYHEIPP